MPRTIYALLVGIDEYAPPVKPLYGCVNDIRRVEALLNKRVTGENDLFEPLILLNREATRQAIIDAFYNHLTQAGPDDVALFYYSGHGSQAPSPPEFWHLEPDRLDETLVCWDSRLPNENGEPEHWDLADKELAFLIAEVAKRNPHINIILDCCHSGSGTRGIEDPKHGARTRRVPTDDRIRPINSFIVTPNAASASQTDSESRSAGQASGWFAMPRGRHVVLSACQAEEEAQEIWLDGEQRGVFSYYLLDTLQSTNNPISYRDIFSRVSALVRSRVSMQFPYMEATDLQELDEPFLGGAIQGRGAYLSVRHDNERGWVIDGGAVHGIPKPQLGETTFLSLFPFDVDVEELKRQQGSIGTASVTEVFPGESTIDVTVDDDGSLDPNTTYKAVITSLPLGVLTVSLAGNDGAVALLRHEMANYNGEGNPSLLVSEGDASGAELQVIAEDDKYRICRNGDAYPLVVDTPGFNPSSARIVLQRLEHMARWFQISTLTNSGSQLKATDVSVSIYREREGHIGVDELSVLEDIRLDYGFDGENWNNKPAFHLRIRNNSERRLYCMLLDLTETYGIHTFVDAQEPLDPGQELWVSDTPLYPEVPSNLWQNGITEFRDTLKLIFTTEPCDATRLTQPELPVNVTRGPSHSAHEPPRNSLERLMTRVGTRAISTNPTHNEVISEWMTSELVITTVRPQKEVVLADPDKGVELGSWINVHAHPALQGAKAKLTSLPAVSRSTGNLTLPPIMRDNPDVFQPLVFSNSRSGTPGLSVLELENVGDHTAVTPDNPLVVDISTSIADDEMVLPIGFDGELYLPLGRATKIDNKVQITLERLPDPTTKGRRSLTGSIKILFQKISNQVLDWPYSYPQLAVAEIVPNSNSRIPFKVNYITDAALVREAVDNATKIVLYIHGIIGNTSGMVLSADPTKLPVPVDVGDISSNYDLILSFDYENLDTPIPETAQRLKEKLAEIGLGPNHGKTLHIVAHSMGGLVSRWFIERFDGNQVVQHLIMLGTPNQGSPWSTVEDYVTSSLGLLLNGFASASLTAQAIGALVVGLEKIDVTLDQMNPNSDFLKELNASPDPEIPYTIIAGNTSIIRERLKSAEGKNLFERLWLRIRPQNWLHALTAPIFFNQPNDIAVLVESIEGVPQSRIHQRLPIQCACDHLTYFSTQEGLSSLAEHMNDTEGIV